MSDADFPALPCMPHILQLAVHDRVLSQRSICDSTASGSRIVGQHSPLAYSRLAHFQKQLGQLKKNKKTKKTGCGHVMEQYTVHAPESLRTETGACRLCSRTQIAMHVHNSPVKINRKYDLHPRPVWRAHTTDQLINCVSCGCDSVYKSSHSSLGEDGGVRPRRENIKNSTTGSW